MIMCLDVGNSQIYGGLFEGGEIKLRFRRSSRQNVSSDEIGLFLKAVLRENNFEPSRIKKIAICSVVPDIVHSLRNCCMKYFGIRPFILQPGVKSGLKIKYRNPTEVGTDRIANAIGATHLFPNKNLIIVDFGTATTFCAVSKDRDYLGGAIIAGLRLNMEVLEARTARLPSVEIVETPQVVGRSTVEGIQSGLYFGHLSMVEGITKRMTQECFKDDKPLLIGTGGFVRLFENTDVFDEVIPDLVLLGLHLALEKNQIKESAPLETAHLV